MVFVFRTFKIRIVVMKIYGFLCPAVMITIELIAVFTPLRNFCRFLQGAFRKLFALKAVQWFRWTKITEEKRIFTVSQGVVADAVSGVFGWLIGSDNAVSGNGHGSNGNKSNSD